MGFFKGFLEVSKFRILDIRNSNIDCNNTINLFKAKHSIRVSFEKLINSTTLQKQIIIIFYFLNV